MNTTDFIGVDRQYKDHVFRILFSDRKNALKLYNALSYSEYTDENDLEIKTLGDAIWMKMKNDIAYLIGDVLTLYEHQSTVNPNMPIRGLLYFADMFRGILKDKHLYGTRLIKLPTPSYIVFYNGNEDIGEEECLKLSDAFIHGNEESKMEFQVRMMNINYGHNKGLMERCPLLGQYAVFVSKIKIYRKEMDMKDAVSQAVDECIAEGVLKEFLMTRRAEVMNSILTEYNEEQVLADIGRERYEDGMAAGKAEGIAAGKAEAVIELLEENGNIPDDLKARIQAERDLAILKRWLKLAAGADNIEKFINEMDKSK